METIGRLQKNPLLSTTKYGESPVPASRCEAVETEDYGCFGGCRSNSDGSHLQVRLPEDAKEGWYDARIRLYYGEVFPQDCVGGICHKKPQAGSSPMRG